MSKSDDNQFASHASGALLKSRKAANIRFRYYGLAAICFALASLLMLVFAIGGRALSAVTYNFVTFEIALEADRIVPDGATSRNEIERNIEGFYALLRDDLSDAFPESRTSNASRAELSGLVTRLTVQPLARKTASSTDMIGRTVRVKIPIADDVDVYLKDPGAWQTSIWSGSIEQVDIEPSGNLTLVGENAFSRIASVRAAMAENSGIEPAELPMLITVGRNTVRVNSITESEVQAELLTGVAEAFTANRAKIRIMRLPESERTITDRQIAWTLALQHDGRIVRGWHTYLVTHTDSTYPELAGTLSALVGSLLTMLVVALLAVPVGIFASIYLEEFAPKNRITTLIEVNINNLAAVPSIVFGLLGAAVFLGVLGLPRSVPLVGGLVLGLLILPVVIIASRASLRAVPDSVRAGALAVGASRMQAVFHHVLPMAVPGMLTGAILGLARALGETAPLLLIGMVAFVAEVPSDVMDESTALPVLIYTWATSAERAWEPMTAAAIVILLGLMVAMNGVVVILRNRFERR